MPMSSVSTSTVTPDLLEEEVVFCPTGPTFARYTCLVESLPKEDQKEYARKKFASQGMLDAELAQLEQVVKESLERKKAYTTIVERTPYWTKEEKEFALQYFEEQGEEMRGKLSASLEKHILASKEQCDQYEHLLGRTSPYWTVDEQHFARSYFLSQGYMERERMMKAFPRHLEVSRKQYQAYEEKVYGTSYWSTEEKSFAMDYFKTQNYMEREALLRSVQQHIASAEKLVVQFSHLKAQKLLSPKEEKEWEQAFLASRFEHKQELIRILEKCLETGKALEERVLGTFANPLFSLEERKRLEREFYALPYKEKEQMLGMVEDRLRQKRTVLFAQYQDAWKGTEQVFSPKEKTEALKWFMQESTEDGLRLAALARLPKDKKNGLLLGQEWEKCFTQGNLSPEYREEKRKYFFSLSYAQKIVALERMKREELPLLTAYEKTIFSSPYFTEDEKQLSWNWFLSADIHKKGQALELLSHQEKKTERQIGGIMKLFTQSLLSRSPFSRFSRFSPEDFREQLLSLDYKKKAQMEDTLLQHKKLVEGKVDEEMRQRLLKATFYRNGGKLEEALSELSLLRKLCFRKEDCQLVDTLSATYEKEVVEKEARNTDQEKLFGYEEEQHIEAKGKDQVKAFLTKEADWITSYTERVRLFEEEEQMDGNFVEEKRAEVQTKEGQAVNAQLSERVEEEVYYDEEEEQMVRVEEVRKEEVLDTLQGAVPEEGTIRILTQDTSREKRRKDLVREGKKLLGKTFGALVGGRAQADAVLERRSVKRLLDRPTDLVEGLNFLRRKEHEKKLTRVKHSDWYSLSSS